MSDNNNPTPTLTTTTTPSTTDTRIPFRRVYMSMTIPMIGRIHVETQYEPIENHNNITDSNTNNGENNATANHDDTRPRLSEILPMMMLMNSLAGGFFLHQHPAFANLTPEQVAAFMQGGGNKPKPAASAEVVECLPRVKIQPNQEIVTCTICQDEMEVDSIAIRMPCGHLYHSDCILPWLKEHNNCPNDRYELLTDDEEYNKNVVLKQAPVKPNININTTPTNTRQVKDSDVEMSPTTNESVTTTDSSNNSDQMNDMPVSSNTTNLPPEVELIVEELKRQVSAKQASKELEDIDMQIDEDDVNNSNNSIDNGSNNGDYVLRNSIKRKRENEESSVTIEDITGHEDEYDN